VYLWFGKRLGRKHWRHRQAYLQPGAGVIGKPRAVFDPAQDVIHVIDHHPSIRSDLGVNACVMGWRVCNHLRAGRTVCVLPRWQINGFNPKDFGIFGAHVAFNVLCYSVKRPRAQ